MYRVYVDNGEKGVVCELCNAYWHYECAKVTQEEIDTIWKEQFVCEMHRQPTKGVALSKTSDSTAHSINDNRIGGNPVLVNIKINSYAINKTSLIKFKLNNMESQVNIKEKACQRQHTIKTNSVTYQILVENFISFGDRLGVKPKRHDIDKKGDSTQDQYEMSLGNCVPVSVTYYHTTNNILVQLKADKEQKGAKKATKTAERIQQLRDFVGNHLTVLINQIESDSRYESLKIQMDANLRSLLEDSQQNSPNPLGDSRLITEINRGAENSSPVKVIEANSCRDGNSPSKSPRKKNGKRCNDECDRLRTALNLRVSTLTKDKMELQPNNETMEKHQESLRGTINSKEGLIDTQTQLINGHLKTIVKNS